MRKNILSLALSGILVLGVTACSDSSETPEFNSSTAQQEQATSPSKASTPVADEFMIIDIDTTVKIPELQKLIDETIVEYKEKVSDIRTQFAKVKSETTAEFNVNINEIKEGYNEQKALFDKNCKDINETNEDTCNKLGENVHSIKSQYEGLEVRLNNQIQKISSDETNALRKLQASMKNNIMKLKSQA